MSISPSLPWDSDTPGGTITLRDITVSEQQLIDGILVFKIRVTEGSSAGLQTANVTRYTDDKLYLEIPALGQFIYEIAHIQYSTNVIQLTAYSNKPAGTYLESVEIS